MDLEASTIRRILKKRGYKWLAKAQKRKYSKADMIRRQAFAENIVRMSAKQLREKLSIAMDGVVITSPPEDAIERETISAITERHTCIDCQARPQSQNSQARTTTTIKSQPTE